MSLSPLYKGDTPVIHGTFEDDNGTIISLSGLSNADLAMHLVNRTGTHKVGSGSWTIMDASGGIADYQMSANDTDTADIWLIYPVVHLSTGPRHFDPQSIVIIDLPG